MVAADPLTSPAPQAKIGMPFPVVRDSIGSWDAAVLGGASLVGNAVEFGASAPGGGGGYISLGSRPFGGALSVAAWVRVDALGRNAKLFDIGWGAPGGNIFLTLAKGSEKSNRTSVGFYTAAGAVVSAESTAGLWAGSLRAWTFVLASFSDAGAVMLFVNGTLAASSPARAAGGGIPPAERNATFGRSLWRGDASFSGAMADLQIFVAALGAGDAESLYRVRTTTERAPPNALLRRPAV